MCPDKHEYSEQYMGWFLKSIAVTQLADTQKQFIFSGYLPLVLASIRFGGAIPLPSLLCVQWKTNACYMTTSDDTMQHSLMNNAFHNLQLEEYRLRKNTQYTVSTSVAV